MNLEKGILGMRRERKAMILKYLELTNFRKFKHAEIEFPDGVVGVFGLNGVGKSTLFEAVAWALYGPVAARTSSSEIKRVNTSSSEGCRVIVEFIFNDNRYRVVREMAGKNLSPSATATMNGSVVAQGADAVTRFIQRLFGMDAKSFFTSLFAKQKELNALSNMAPGERKQLIMRMLGIDALDRALKNIRLDVRRTKDAIEHYLVSMRDEATGRQKKEIYRERIAEKKEEENKLKERLKVKRERISVLREEFENLRDKKRSAEEEYERVQKRFEDLRGRKELYDKRKRLEEEIKKLEKSLKKREMELREKEKEVESYRGVKEDFERVKGELEEVNLKLSDLIGNIKQEETRIDGIDGEIRKTRSKMGRIKSLGPSAPCPTCERVLGDHYQRLIDKFEREILENNEAKRKLEETLDGYRKEKKRFERLKEALLKKKDHLSELKEKESSAFALLQAVRTEFEKERQEKEEKEKEFFSIKTISFDERVFHEVEERMRRCYTKYKESINEVERKQKELHAAEGELKDLEGDLRLIGQSIQEIRERMREQEEMEKRVEDEKRKRLILNLLERVMQAFRTDMISRVRPTVSTYASILLETLTEGKYSELELNENYDILMYDGGSAYEINRFSGGEEDLANLCIRLAVSEMLTDRAGGEFNLIILDEVFGSQDVNRRRNILSALNLLSNKFRQIFLITHIEEIKQFVTNAILVYETENGTSRVEME